MVFEHCIYTTSMIPLQFPLGPGMLRKSWKCSAFSEKRHTLRKKVPLTPLKVKIKAIFFLSSRIHLGMYFLQKTRSNLVYLGLWSLISDLHTPIGGSHRVLYFTTQITEKYSTAKFKISLFRALTFLNKRYEIRLTPPPRLWKSFIKFRFF